jgi:hypothetical protein
MVNRGNVDLQMKMAAMNRLLSSGLVGTAGQTYGSTSIWDAMVSDLEWETLEPMLDRMGVPYKAKPRIRLVPNWSRTTVLIGRKNNVNMQVEAGQCRLCPTVGPFVKSHIVPSAFVSALRPNGENATVRMYPSDGRAKNVRTGVYGRFLCLACETRMQPWDEYGTELFLYEPRTAQGPDVLLIGGSPIDYQKLKLFVMSMMWRASACEHEFFAGASLNSLEDVYRQRLRDSDPGEAIDPRVIIYKLRLPFGTVALPPCRYELGDTQFVMIYFGEFVAYVQVAGGPLSVAAEEQVIRPSDERYGGLLRVPCRDLYDWELAGIQHVAKERANLQQRSQK